MSSISTSIAIYDKVSAPINNIISALSDMCDAYESVERSMGKGFDTSKIVSARAALDRAADSVIQLGRNTDNAESEQKEYNRAVSNGGSAMDGLVGKVAGLVATYASLQTVGKLVNLSDEMALTTSRLGLLVEGEEEVKQLQKDIYEAAQRSRGEYQAMANTVTKLGLVADKAFSGTEEMVAFSELLNKNFVVGGASATEQASAMYQLTQAMGSGRLQGDEYRSIIENAPLLAKSIEDYMRNVQGATGTMKEWAAEGLLTADVIKAAVFESADEVEQRFAQMPMTWGQVWTMMKNNALMRFQPVLDKINSLANNAEFQQNITNVMTGLANVVNFALDAIDVISGVASFMYDNWSLLEPIVWGLVFALGAWVLMLGIAKVGMLIHSAVTAISSLANGTWTWSTFAQTAAQQGLNAALLACPLTWIIILIIAVIAVIYLVIAAIIKATGSTQSAMGIICGAFSVAVAFIWNLLLSLLDFILGIINALVNPWIAWINFFGNLFNDPIGSIIHLFGDFADNILGIIETIARGIDKVFGSNLAGSVAGWREGLDSKIDEWASKYGNGSYEAVVDSMNLSSESLGLKRWGYGDAYQSGYDWGDELADKFSIDMDSQNNMFDPESYDAANAPSNIANTSDNTDKMVDSLDISSEDLKYLRDIAERDVINRFTTAEIKVEMTNNNNISSDTDLDGIVDYLVNGVSDAMAIAAEGVPA